MSALTKYAVLLVGGIGLSACNSSSSTTSTSGTVNPTPANIQQALDTDTGVRVSNAVSILTRDTNNNTVATSDRQDVSVTTSKNAAGEIVINLTGLGRTVSFEPSDLNASGNEYSKTLPDGSRVFLWTYDGTWQDVQQGTGKFKYMVRFGTSDVVNGVNTRAYGVLGTKTAAAQLPTSGTASYRATKGMRADIYSPSDPNRRNRVYGDVEIDVNFANSQVTGQFNNLEVDGASDTTVFRLAPTTASNGSFSTTAIVENASANQTLSSSSLNGSFYGDQAQEVGGDFNFVGTSSSGAFVGAGVFGASKQ